jgi:membrane fusion protein (multidrug efflux system)
MTKQKKVMSAVGTVAAAGAIYFVVDFLRFVTTDNAQIEAHTVMLSPKVGGFIKSVHVLEGQKVKRGDVLVEIDDRDYINALNQYKGELTSIAARKADAEKNHRRLTDLYAKGAVSQQQFDGVSSQYSELKAKFEATSALVTQAELNLEHTKILAPSDGFIAKRAVEEGQLASPGVPLFGFVDAEERWVMANFKETELEAIQVGHNVDVSVDAVSSRSYRGKVVAIDAATGSTFTLLPPDNATGNFTKVVQRVPVKISLDNLSVNDIETLRAGLSAYVKIHKY